MGNNEPFPPPPPGGPAPQPPQPPRDDHTIVRPPQYQQPTQQQPQYPPQYQQPTQQQPQYQQPYPGQPYPPQQYGQFPQAAAPAPKKNTGLIIGVGVVVVAAVVAAVLIFSGGDDNKTVTTTPITRVPVNTGSNDTIVLTVPDNSIVTPIITTPDNPVTTFESSLVTITDDLGEFAVMVPDDMQVLTTPLVSDSQQFAQIRAAYDMDGFNNTDDAFGFMAVVATGAPGTGRENMLDGLSPTAGCTSQSDSDPPVTTLFGDALVRRFEGCGTGGQYAKIIIAAQDPNSGKLIGFYVQGPDSDTLLSYASVMILTLTLF